MMKLKLKDFDDLRVKPGKAVDLSDHKTDRTHGVPKNPEEAIETLTQKLGVLQENLYAEGRRSLLVVLQGLDASGKDGTVRHVFDHVNPTGIQVISFKQPTTEELRHDFLWRCHNRTPPRGYIGVFNRSHYEDVLVVRVHADKLLAPELRGEGEGAAKEWQRRYRMITAFERILEDAGTRVLKFFLHISKEEQRQRFIARQKDPTKHWKLAEGDFEERKYWDHYQRAYEQMFPATSTKEAPWYIIPSDHKKARDFYIAGILVGILKEMDPQPPKLANPALTRLKFK
ncbi:MAG: polyphosphate kinase 2 family protein [Phycisphaerales bacterium]|nr:polyphosphate kinase 2 family protein [Phycisphaerales bacterium]